MINLPALWAQCKRPKRERTMRAFWYSSNRYALLVAVAWAIAASTGCAFWLALPPLVLFAPRPPQGWTDAANS